MYERAGFVEVARRRTQRPMMRLALGREMTVLERISGTLGR